MAREKREASLGLSKPHRAPCNDSSGKKEMGAKRPRRLLVPHFDLLSTTSIVLSVLYSTPPDYWLSHIVIHTPTAWTCSPDISHGASFGVRSLSHHHLISAMRSPFYSILSALYSNLIPLSSAK